MLLGFFGGARRKHPCNCSYGEGAGADAAGVVQVLALPPRDSWPAEEDEAGGAAGAGGLAAWGSRQLNLRRLRRCSWTEDLETCGPSPFPHISSRHPTAAPAALPAQLAPVLHLPAKFSEQFSFAVLKACEGGVLSENT